MSLPLAQQIHESVRKAGHILIAFPHEHAVDHVCAALSLEAMLRRMGKKDVTVACHGFAMPKQLEFLTQDPVRILDRLPAGNTFRIRVRTADAEIETLRYDTSDEFLDIMLSLKQGTLAPEHVSGRGLASSFDLAFVLGAKDLEALGKLFQDNAKTFYDTPIVNMDCGSGNEHFGQMNLVEMTATSVCEILYDFFRKHDAKLADERLATMLLAGIVSATKAFKIAQVTPRSLSAVSDLLSKGARRDLVIRNLYQNKPVATLQLWGRALARLQADDTAKLAWTRLVPDDFAKTGASASDLSGIVDELIRTSPDTEIVALFFEETAGNAAAIVYAGKSPTARELTAALSPKGNDHEVRVSMQGRTLEQLEREIMQEIRKKLGPVVK